nr:hypothetical protein [Tanacetum cinerariifolium]
MSSSTHPIILDDSYVEDAFSSKNIPNYTLALPNYSPASPGNTFSDPLKNLTRNLLAVLAISPLHDDPYMKVMQAYNAELTIQAPISLPSSLVDFYSRNDHRGYPGSPPIRYKESSGSDLISTLEMIIEDIQVRHRSDIRSLLEAICELKNK